MSLLDDFADDGGYSYGTGYGDGGGSFSSDLPDEPLVEPGYVTLNTKLDEEPPIFRLSRVNYTPQSKFKSVSVQNGVVAMGLEDGHLLRLDMEDASHIDDIELGRSTDRLLHVFVDPTGHHVIVSFSNGDVYYVHKTWRKARMLSRLRGNVVESLAWNKSNSTKSSTGEILVGTMKGKIILTGVEVREKSTKPDERNPRLLTTLPEGHCVTGLHFEQFPSGKADEDQFALVATTPTRIYQFVGGPTLESMMAQYQTTPGFQELPGGTQKRSKLLAFNKMAGQRATHFAWLTGPGVYHGSLQYGSQKTGDSVLTETALLQYPEEKREGDEGEVDSPKPISMVLTEHHFLLLYQDRYTAICRLSGDEVHSELLPVRRGSFVDVVHDAVRNTFWLHSDVAIFEVVVHEEDRDIWRILLDKKQFADALNMCKDAAQRDIVQRAQADNYFESGKYELAAKFYANTEKSFEEVALKLIAGGLRDALKVYLLEKLENIPSTDATQATILCTWLTEIYLDKITRLQMDAMSAEASRVAALDDTTRDAAAAEHKRLLDQHAMIQEEFRGFLTERESQLNRNTTYHLISSHGRVDELLFYAGLVKDHARVMGHHIQHGNYKEALDEMIRQDDLEVYYQLSPDLMEKAPHATVNAWMRQQQLDPRRLIPALMRYKRANNEPGHNGNEAIRYLMYCVTREHNRDPVVHNYLLSLYAEEEDDEGLLTFLNRDTDSYYDPKYALRLCTRHGKELACVHIYGQMELYEEAVELALSIGDLELATINADRPEGDDGLRRKLWLRIARHVVEKEKDIRGAMQFMQQCDLLKIEDVLPFFPDFVLINDFKDEICASLEDYNRHIQELQSEMDSATKSANRIREDIALMKERSSVIRAGQKCDICHHSVLSRQFYAFPCHHMYHRDCLTKEVKKGLDRGSARKLGELEGVLAAETAAAKAAQIAGGTPRPQLEIVQRQLDNIVASDCMLCGEVMIRSVDRPFMDPETESDLIRSWRVD